MLRGWDPSNPQTRTQRAPVAPSTTILSGQVCSLAYQNGELEFNLGVTAQDTDIPFFAVQDSTDFDVISSGVLTGLSSLDDYELQTAYFNPTPTTTPYTFGAALRADGNTGNVTTQILADGTAPATIIGYLSRFNGPNDIIGEDSSTVADGNGQVLVLTLQTAFQRNAVHATAA